MIFFVKICLSRRPYSDQGVATELSWRSIAFLRCSWWRFSALSRCFHCAFTARLRRSQRLRAHSACAALSRRCRHFQERRAVSVQTPRTTTAFAQRPLCAPTELLLRCRRPYCAAMVTLQMYTVLNVYLNSPRNNITTLALYGHGSETILFFSMGHGKVIHFPIIIFLWDILQQSLIC